MYTKPISKVHLVLSYRPWWYNVHPPNPLECKGSVRPRSKIWVPVPKGCYLRHMQRTSLQLTFFANIILTEGIQCCHKCTVAESVIGSLNQQDGTMRS